MPKKILIADDHSAIRNGVKQILTDELNSVEFGEAANGAEVLKKMNEKKWDILILDVDMPGRNGLEILYQLKENKSNVPVLIFSMHPEEQLAVRALKAGASGYLSKNALNDELIQAVQKILSGKKYITPVVADLLVSQIENPLNKAPHELLSDRELHTFLLIAKGKSISEIADELSLSTQSISTFRHRILEKMQMKTTAELVTYAIQNKLA